MLHPAHIETAVDAFTASWILPPDSSGVPLPLPLHQAGALVSARVRGRTDGVTFHDQNGGVLPWRSIKGAASCFEVPAGVTHIKPRTAPATSPGHTAKIELTVHHTLPAR